MTFQKQKKNILSKIDKSKKGSIDKEIKKLVDKINSFDCYYTTSSCSGRILILTSPESGRKNEVEWLFDSHSKIKFNDLKLIIKKIKNFKENIWFKSEAAILHVVADNIENAVKLMNIARDIGFRRSGIISIKNNKVSMELISTERLEAIIAKKGNLIVTNDYLKELIKEANDKLKKTRIKISKLLLTQNL